MSAGRKQIQVEFFGLPGSGKTTIAHALYRLLRDPGTIYSPHVTLDHEPSVPRVAGRSLLIARGFPWRGTDWRALYAIVTARQRTHLDTAKTLFNYLTVTSMYRRLDAHSAVVDQGMLQAIWSANLRRVDSSWDKRWDQLLFRESGTARHYACVEAPILTCVERLSARPGRHSRMQSVALLNDPDAWERAERIRTRVMEGLVACFRIRGMSPRVVVVDGTRDPAELAAGILGRILDAGSSPAIEATGGPP